MCNDFGNRIPYDGYLRAFSQIRVPLKWPKAVPNLEPRDDIWPTDPAGIWCALPPVLLKSAHGSLYVHAMV
jgi:hypothetical protein